MWLVGPQMFEDKSVACPLEHFSLSTGLLCGFFHGRDPICSGLSPSTYGCQHDERPNYRCRTVRLHTQEVSPLQTWTQGMPKWQKFCQGTTYLCWIWKKDSWYVYSTEFQCTCYRCQLCILCRMWSAREGQRLWRKVHIWADMNPKPTMRFTLFIETRSIHKNVQFPLNQ